MIRVLLTVSLGLCVTPIANAAAFTMPSAGSPDCMKAPTYRPGTNLKKRPGKPDKVLVFDASPSEENAATANRIFVLAPCTKSSVVSELWRQLNSQFNTTTGDAVPYTADTLREFLFQNADTLAELSSSRWISHKGQQLDVYVVHAKGVTKTIDFDEAERKSHIERDLTTLVQLAEKIGSAKIPINLAFYPAPPPPKDTSRFRVTERSYTLGKELADLKVSVGTGPAAKAAGAKPAQTPNPDPKNPAAGGSPTPAPTPNPTLPKKPKPRPPSPKPERNPRSDLSSIAESQSAITADSTTADEGESPDQASGEPGPEKLETTIVTGPTEHFFLSANAGVTDATQVTYDDATRALGPAKKPTGFYIATNYAFSDLYTEGEDTNFANRFILGMYLGTFVQASRRPFEQFGAIIGFRRNLIPPLETFLPFDTVSPFLGVVWVRNDRIAGSPSAPTLSSRYGKGKFVTGLSLNLDKALGWVGSGKSDQTSQ